MIGMDLNAQDEWGGIDEKIKPIVAALNSAGIPTSGSCEGHADRGYPSPWVAVRAKDGSELPEIRKKTASLLERFYSERDVPPEIKISILDGHAGFTLHARGDDFKKMRERINEGAARKAAGEKVEQIVINEEEKMRRAEELPLMRAEMDAFAKFILGE